MTKKTLIIAEAGVNHNGRLDFAKSLIDVAASSGADIVKFQTFNANRLATRAAKKADYQLDSSGSLESQHSMLSRLELSESMHHELIAHCKIRKIGFLSTGFDIESIDFLNSLGQEQFKIPSGEITNLPYLKHIGQINKPVILSTGMSTMDEIGSAIKILENSGTQRNKITILQCTSEYPARITDANLRVMQSIQLAFGVEVGYSDHTEGIEASLAAVALGATIIEKHFTLNRHLPGPDHQMSIESLELKELVKCIRNIEKALGDGIKKITPIESKNRLIVRKSIVASQLIKAGETLTMQNLTTKRPGTGISPMQLNNILGAKARRDFLPDELIEI